VLSSPFSNAPATVRLRVAAGSPLAEVFLIDHEFALVARSVGNLDTDLEPGVYKLKAWLGETAMERLIVLNRDQSLDLSKDLPMVSPAPIEGTSRTHEFHMGAAAVESAKVAFSAGRGAEIFLMARRWSSHESPATGSDPKPAAPPELSLHRSDKQVIVDLSLSGPGVRRDWDPCLGINVAVDPGTYLLRWRDDSGSKAEQSVHAVRGWQTQVFLLDDASGPAETRRHRVSVLMARGGFRPGDSMLRLVEEARSALADERKVASGLVSKSLFAKFDNPMLGLFGAHLMLLARDAVREDEERQRRLLLDAKRVPSPVRFDQSLFDLAVDNLRNLLGADHPDVAALSTHVAGQRLDALEPATMPPMMWRSWLLLIEASNAWPALVPVATWRRTLKLLPQRPFLVWSLEEGEAETGKEWEREVSRTLAGSSAPPPPPGAAAPRVTPGAEITAFGAPAPDETRRRLSLQLLAPRAAIDELVAGAPP
jgi:hypothetical protein